MPLLATLLIAGASVASPSPSVSTLRLTGLDRLYFRQVGSGDALKAQSSVAALLPRKLGRSLPGPPSPPETPPEVESNAEAVATRDFPLPLPTWPRKVVLRQVVDFSHPRISELWLALYDGGRRSDVWHFQALPSRTDSKLLPNYWIDSVKAGPDGGLVVRLQGNMSRPQGAWWATGKVVTLTLGNGVLALSQVRNAFSFNRAYDVGGDSDPRPALAVSVEREVGGRFERRDRDPVPADVETACGTAAVDDGPGTWDDMEAIAECVTRAPSKVSFRTPRDPSFAERGYQAKR